MGALKIYRSRLREEVIDSGDAPHALEVLLSLDGDGVQGPVELPSCHRHLDAGLLPRGERGALRPAGHSMSLPQGQDVVGDGLAFVQLLCMDARGRQGESGRLR